MRYGGDGEGFFPVPPSLRRARDLEALGCCFIRAPPGALADAGRKCLEPPPPGEDPVAGAQNRAPGFWTTLAALL
jgi:hypothetical protein